VSPSFKRDKHITPRDYLRSRAVTNLFL